MSYFIVTDGKDGATLFLVNRSITRKKWWTKHLYEAMCFKSAHAAQTTCSGYRYNNPTVISEKEALDLEKQNELMYCDDHIFSPEALGQS